MRMRTQEDGDHPDPLFLSRERSPSSCSIGFLGSGCAHDTTSLGSRRLPLPCSLHCSLTPHSSAGYMRASERSSERVAPPGPTRSSRRRRRRGPIIANLCAEPLYYLRRSGALLPSLSPSLVAVAACPFGPSLVPRPSPVRRLAMHEESDEIPLPLSLASYSSSSLCITMCGTP